MVRRAFVRHTQKKLKKKKKTENERKEERKKERQKEARCAAVSGLYLSIATLKPVKRTKGVHAEVLVAAVNAVLAVVTHQGVRHMLHGVSTLERRRK